MPQKKDSIDKIKPLNFEPEDTSDNKFDTLTSGSDDASGNKFKL
jgi:hypothetical protein